jgi:peptidoglycan/LPS O-acetylase OafA/YrhL
VVVVIGGILPMGALNNGIGSHGSRLVPAAADALILAGIGLAVSGRVVRAGSWLAAVAGLLLLTINQNHYPLPWSGYTILAFMFTGTLIYRAESGQVARWKAAVIAAAVLAMTVGGGLWHGGWNTSSAQWQWQWVTSLAGAAVTFGLGLMLRERRVPRILAWLGMISYSVYLLHPLVLDAFRDVPTLHHASKGLVVQLPMAAGLIGVVIASSALTYYLVEKPMQRLGHTVARRWEGPQTRCGSGAASGAGAGTATSPPTVAVPVSAVPVGAHAARSASISKTVAGGSGGSP